VEEGIPKSHSTFSPNVADANGERRSGLMLCFVMTVEF